jgi:transcriptional regulator with XRE-family HTH domain
MEPQVSPIRIRRDALGLSQAELAVAAGLAVSTVHLAERHGPSPRVAFLLAGVLGCAPDDITNPHRLELEHT